MTGEITLRGNVLPVGGIKGKRLAAHRAGIKRVLLPERNQKDMVDVPDEVKAEMEVIYVKRMDEVLPLVLTEVPERLTQPPPPPVGLVSAPPTPVTVQNPAATA